MMRVCRRRWLMSDSMGCKRTTTGFCSGKGWVLSTELLQLLMRTLTFRPSTCLSCFAASEKRRKFWSSMQARYSNSTAHSVFIDIAIRNTKENATSVCDTGTLSHLPVYNREQSTSNVIIRQDSNSIIYLPARASVTIFSRCFATQVVEQYLNSSFSNGTIPAKLFPH